MNKNIEIQLGTESNIDGVNVDNFENISLENKKLNLLEYDVRNILNVTSVYERERQNTPIYRIYGGLEYLSYLNGIINNYVELRDLFIPQNFNSNVKDIFNSFDFYIVKPASDGYEKTNYDSITYVRKFEVLTKINDFNLFNAGYSKNLFNEPKYSYIISRDIDISNMVDGFGLPLTELYIYCRYNPTTNGSGVAEKLKQKKWDLNNDNNVIYEQLTYQEFNIGDVVYGDMVEYSPNTMFQTITDQQEYKIIVNVEEYGDIQFTYNPFLPLRLRYFTESINRVNINSTDYDKTIKIPNYAYDTGNGNYIWRDILEQGLVDPINGNGVDYPFVNKRRYLFSNQILSISPDYDDANTNDVFRHIKYDEPSLLNNEPITEIDNIGKPCQ